MFLQFISRTTVWPHSYRHEWWKKTNVPRHVSSTKKAHHIMIRLLGYPESNFNCVISPPYEKIQLVIRQK